MQRLFALCFLLIALPIIILVSVIILLTTGYPFFFFQERIGKNQTPFTIYKFKSMKNNKVTFIGKVIRKTGIDEIPQLVNILKGEMSFVGPRPLTKSDIKRLNWTEKEHLFRWSVKPGITGLAQLSSICNAENSLRLDKKYIEEKSISIDLKLFLKSLLIPLTGKSKQH